MKPFTIRVTLTISLVLATAFNLSACSNEGGLMDTTSENGGEYVIAAKSNMLKGLEYRRTKQSTQPINNGIGALSTTDSSPATTQHTNELLYYWPDVSNAVKQMKGIAAAHVFATNKNAYVAIMFTDEQNAAAVVEKKGYDKFHRHDVAPRTIAAMPYDYFYTVEQDSLQTNQIYHDVGRLVNNHAAPRQVFISSNHDLFHHLNDYVKIERRNRSLLPWINEFNVLVQYYFGGSSVEPTKVGLKK